MRCALKGCERKQDVLVDGRGNCMYGDGRIPRNGGRGLRGWADEISTFNHRGKLHAGKLIPLDIGVITGAKGKGPATTFNMCLNRPECRAQLDTHSACYNAYKCAVHRLLGTKFRPMKPLIATTHLQIYTYNKLSKRPMRHCTPQLKNRCMAWNYCQYLSWIKHTFAYLYASAVTTMMNIQHIHETLWNISVRQTLQWYQVGGF